jgi:hypothetical protein
VGRGSALVFRETRPTCPAVIAGAMRPVSAETRPASKSVDSCDCSRRAPHGRTLPEGPAAVTFPRNCAPKESVRVFEGVPVGRSQRTPGRTRGDNPHGAEVSGFSILFGPLGTCGLHPQPAQKNTPPAPADRGRTAAPRHRGQAGREQHGPDGDPLDLQPQGDAATPAAGGDLAGTHPRGRPRPNCRPATSRAGRSRATRSGRGAVRPAAPGRRGRRASCSAATSRASRSRATRSGRGAVGPAAPGQRGRIHPAAGGTWLATFPPADDLTGRRSARRWGPDWHASTATRPAAGRPP